MSIETIKDCAQRAYGDLVRKPLIGIGSLNESDKREYKNAINKVIANSIEALFKQSLQSSLAFDKWHIDLYNKMRNLTEVHEIQITFTYGIAQKWINMTLKYMLIMELWDDMLIPLKPFLHASIDNNILEAAWDDFEDISMPLSKGEKRGIYAP